MSIFGFSQSGRDSGGFNISFQNAQLISAIMGEMSKELRKEANTELRDAAGKIALSLIPGIKAMAAMSPMPIASAMADTARVKRDRMISVQIGGVNPSLRGFKKGVGSKGAAGRKIKRSGGREATSKNYRTTLAWASEFGPYPGSSFNRYKVSRREGGYYVQPAVNASADRAKHEYEKALNLLITRYSEYR